MNDFATLHIKIGDIDTAGATEKCIKNGMIGAYTDALQWANSHEYSDHMKKVYALVRVDIKTLPRIFRFLSFI